MTKLLWGAFILLCVAGIFSFTVVTPSKKNDEKTVKTQGLPHKWFKYRAGESGVPAPSSISAKVASNYVMTGDNPYCGGDEAFCGVYAEPSDNTPTALPILTSTEENDIDAFFSNPSEYNGALVDRLIE